MHRPSLVRGGDEGDLVTQLTLLELFDWLAPEQGHFSYVETHALEGRMMADLPALDWFAMAQQSGPLGWSGEPLFELQKAALSEGHVLSTSFVALQRLSRWHKRGVSVRFCYAHQTPKSLQQFQFDMSRAIEQGLLPVGLFGHQARLMQLVSTGVDSLQELVYLGGLRSPGVAFVSPPDLQSATTALLPLLETLLMRRFWVVLQCPPLMSGSVVGMRPSHDRQLDALEDGVRKLGTPCLKLRVQGRRLSWRPEARFDVWVMSPGIELGSFQARLQKQVNRLFIDGLGRDTFQGVPDGVSLCPIECAASPLRSFLMSFPKRLGTHLEMDRAREGDLSEVIHLWEQLMDEHAEFDEHFRRRPLARLYLRHSFSSQLNQPDYVLLVVRWKRKPVGFLSAQILRAPLFQESRLGQVVDLYVQPEWRGQGVGKALVNCVMEWFRAMQIEQVDLNVAVRNDRGVSFWEREGFQPYLRVVSKQMSED